MKKKSSKIYFILISVGLLYYILKFSGILALYTISSSANEPTIKTGSYILSTNIKTPKRGDLITFKFKDHLYKDLPYQNFTYIFRLCGVENDTIEIKKGVFYVNGENFDQQYELQHSYILNQTQFDNLENVSLESLIVIKDTFIISMKDSDAKLHVLEKYKHIEKKDHPDDFIVEKYQQNWNKDHFEPLIIPEGKIFVLGDNRSNSRDSRYIGFIDVSAITGVHWITLF